MQMRFLLFCCILGLHHFMVVGQTPATNPFELEHRVREAMQQLGIKDSTAASSAVLNPFDVVSHRSPSVSRQDVQPKLNTGLGKITLRPQSSTKKTFVFAFLGILLGFLGLTFGFRRSVAVKAWSAFFSNNFLQQAQRDYTGMIGGVPFYMLYVHFFINAGLFVFLFFRSLTGDQFNYLGFLLLCIGVVTGLFLLKHFVVTLAGWIFGCHEEASKYNFLILIFSSVLGLFLLPANLFLALRAGVETILPFWVVAMIAVFYVFRWLRSAGLFGSFMGKNFFHILLYLCAVEIIPFLILLKLFMNGLGSDT